MAQSLYASPIGTILITATDMAVTGLDFYDDESLGQDDDCEIIAQTRLWLDEYFSGTEPSFVPPMQFHSTKFRTKVWNFLLTIPYGKTISYSDIAKALHSSPRAVGQAVGHNPISLIVPCHRVIGADGSMTGYAWGIDRKQFLLSLEQIRSKTE